MTLARPVWHRHVHCSRVNSRAAASTPSGAWHRVDAIDATTSSSSAISTLSRAAVQHDLHEMVVLDVRVAVQRQIVVLGRLLFIGMIFFNHGLLP